MRPVMADKLTPANVLAVVHALADDYIIQPKLNGDRVILRKVNGSIEVFNRHQGRYTFNVNAVLDWAALPECTVLDGEGYAGKFYPFEAVMDAPVEARIAEARRLCLLTGNAFIFDAPTDAWLLRCQDNLPQWEGIVAKQRGTRYEWLHKPNHTSWQWLKCKW
jgi:ATP-dependent DNA ligase